MLPAWGGPAYAALAAAPLLIPCLPVASSKTASIFLACFSRL
jgi:hypothetical protein